MPMVAIKVTFIDAKPEPHVFKLDVMYQAFFDESLKDKLIRYLGDDMGLALDPNQYRMDWEVNHKEPHVILRRI